MGTAAHHALRGRSHQAGDVPVPPPRAAQGPQYWQVRLPLVPGSHRPLRNQEPALLWEGSRTPMPGMLEGLSSHKITSQISPPQGL